MPDGRLPVPGTQLPGDGGGGPVGQEDRDIDHGGQGLAGHPEAAERHRADPADDGRVPQQEQRLGHQRTERGDREPEDLRVVRAGTGEGREPAAASQPERVHGRIVIAS